MLEKTSAMILSEKSFYKYLLANNINFFGNGAFKCRQIFSSEKAKIHDTFELSSAYMAPLAYKKFLAAQFEDIAYFEPFYLKDFVTTTPKKIKEL